MFYLHFTYYILVTCLSFIEIMLLHFVHLWLFLSILYVYMLGNKNIFPFSWDNRDSLDWFWFYKLYFLYDYKFLIYNEQIFYKNKQRDQNHIMNVHDKTTIAAQVISIGPNFPSYIHFFLQSGPRWSAIPHKFFLFIL